MKLHQLVKFVIEDKDLYQYVYNEVHNKPRERGVVMYQTLFSLMQYFIDDELRCDYVCDILDTLTGQCHVNCIIGTGDYHIEKGN